MNPKRQTALKILKEKELYGPEEFINQVYAVSGDPRLVSRAVSLGERYMVAFRLLIQMLGSSSAGTSVLKEKQEKKEIVQEPKAAEGEEAVPKEKKAPPSEEEAVPDFYGTLGVKEVASKEEIKVAHRALIKKYHPDVYSGQGLSQKEVAEIKSYAQEVNLAYDILSKEGNRTDYDKARKIFTVSPPAIPPSSPLGDITKRATAKIAGKPVKKGLKKLAGKKAAGKVIKKAAGKTVGQVVDKAATAVGTAIGGPVGAAIAKAISWVVRKGLGLVKKAFGKIAEVLTGEKDTRKQIAYLATAGAVIFVGLGMVVPAAAAGLVAVGAGAASLGAARIGSGISGIGQSFVYGLTAVAAPAIGVPILVALIIVPLIITLIIFIINSGAYVVPPGPPLVSALVENPYISVQKLAKVEGASGEGEAFLDFEISDLPQRIVYTITVTAKRATLTNINFDWNCQVISDFGQTCPAYTVLDVNGEPAPNTLPPVSPSLISPANPFIITYTMLFSSGEFGFEDTLTIDTFTVAADVESEGVTQAQAAASASVLFGNPPSQCPVSWPVNREGSEPPLPILQGPHTSGGTHDIVEAIDVFAASGYSFTGHIIRATHTGAVVIGDYGAYGNFVDITSRCVITEGEEITVTSRYAHLNTINVSTGQIVDLGQVLGTGGSDGTAQPHLHYEFRPVPGPIPMDPPYLPLAIPDGCYNFAGNPCICSGIQCAII